MKGILNIPEKKLSKKEYRDWIVELENSILAMEESMDRFEIIRNGFELRESFTPGIYMRSLTMPADQIVFSRVHNQEHPFVITKGLVSVYDGEDVNTFQGPHHGVTPKGTKRVLVTHEETTWVTYHPISQEYDDDQDMAEIVTCKTFEEFDKLEHIE